MPSLDDEYAAYLMTSARPRRSWGKFYDLDGREIEADEWHRLTATPGLRVLDRQETQHGHVLTMWLGADEEPYCCATCEAHGPRIFGTAVFRHGSLSEEVTTPTREAARRAHRWAVAVEGPAWRPCPGGCPGS